MSASPHADADWSAQDYDRNARFVIDLAADLLDWLAPQPGERVLDIGCGNATMSQRIAERGAIVTGIDTSPAMVEAARAAGITAQVVDAQAMQAADIGTGYDAAFSNAALHWMKQDPDAVLAQVHARLAPDARFVAEMGASGNIAPIHEALCAEADVRGMHGAALDPWFFPTAEDYRKRLLDAGFAIERFELFERPTVLPGDMHDWLTTLARPFVTAFADGAPRAAFIDAVAARLRTTCQNDDGQWQVPYVRLRFVARK